MYSQRLLIDALEVWEKLNRNYYLNLIIENDVFEGRAYCTAVRVSFMTSYLVHLIWNIIFWNFKV